VLFTVPKADVSKKDKNQSETNVMPKPALHQVRKLRKNIKFFSARYKQ